MITILNKWLKLGILLSLCSMLLVNLSCNKKKKKVQQEANHPVPYLPIDVTIYPNNPSYFPIQSIGGWVYQENVGIRGVIIYRKSNEEFVVLERSSTHLPDNPAARVKVMGNNFDLIDTVSNSKWRIFDGQVLQGPATWNLRIYGSSYDGNRLRIVN